MLISQALQRSFTTLKPIFGNDSNLDCYLLLGFVLKKPKEFLFTYPEKSLTATQEKSFFALVEKRRQGMPIAYLTHEKYFYGLRFTVNRNVLIPRPETEELVHTVIETILNENPKVTVADIGTGSGAIAVAIKKFVPPVTMYASDISEQALTVAKKNALAHNVKITWKKGDLFKPFTNMKIDVVIANLPYVPESSRVTSLPTETSVKVGYELRSASTIGLAFEPHRALYSGTDGFVAINALLRQIATAKHTPSYIILEHHETHGRMIKKIAKVLFPWAKVKTFKDLCGLDRYSVIILNSTPNE